MGKRCCSQALEHIPQSLWVPEGMCSKLTTLIDLGKPDKSPAIAHGSPWGQAGSETWPSVQSSRANISNTLQLLTGLCLFFLLQGGKQDGVPLCWLFHWYTWEINARNYRCHSCPAVFLNIKKEPLAVSPPQLEPISLFSLLNIYTNTVIYL